MVVLLRLPKDSVFVEKTEGTIAEMFATLSLYELELKVGTPIILTRNLNAPKLRNGTNLHIIRWKTTRLKLQFKLAVRKVMLFICSESSYNNNSALSFRIRTSSISRKTLLCHDENQ